MRTEENRSSGYYEPGRSLFSLIGLLTAGLLASCGPASSTQAPPSAETTGSPSAPQPTIDLQPCQLGSTPALCGTLRVYENRAARSGRMIDLRVALIKAQSPHPAPDPIFCLAGGPGSVATEDGARQQCPYSLSDNHDLVFVDQRGTGRPNRWSSLPRSTSQARVNR